MKKNDCRDNSICCNTNFISCSNDSISEQKNEPTTNEIASDTSNEIQLDNGNKWEVNEEMKPFILEAEKIVEDYILNSSNDYQNLATQLKEKNKGLIQNCSMEGPSHDELHKWLHPHMDLIDALSNSQNQDEAQAIIQQLEKSFDMYHTYFQ